MRMGEPGKAWEPGGQFPSSQVRCEGHGTEAQGQLRQGTRQSMTKGWALRPPCSLAPARGIAALDREATRRPWQRPWQWAGGPILEMQRWCFSDWAAVARKVGCLGRVEEFPVMHRLRRLEDKMFLPVQSPPCSCLSAIFARVPLH